PAGLARVFPPRFERWLAPREPIVDQPQEQRAATFERRDRSLAADAKQPAAVSATAGVGAPSARQSGCGVACLASGGLVPQAGGARATERSTDGVAGAATEWISEVGASVGAA